MTNDEAKRRLLDIERCTPIHTREDARDFEALEMAIQALSQVSEIKENIIKYMKKYPNHVGNTDFWEGFYACRNVVLQLDDEEYAPKEQEPCDDAEQIDYHDDFETASRKIHDYEERQKQNDKRCGNCKLIGTDTCYMVCGGSKSLYKPKQKLEPCDDAISRILKRMWNCRGKHTTSIDKVKMEQIIRDELSVTQKITECDDAVSREDALMCLTGMFKLTKNYNPEELIALFSKRIKSLPPVTQKSGKWITKPHVYGVTYCSECDFELKIDDTNYCPNCGAKMESEDKE